MKRVRYEDVPVGGYCETEWKEKVIKTETVRIYTDGNINYRNAANIENGELLPINGSQWVWIANALIIF